MDSSKRLSTLSEAKNTSVSISKLAAFTSSLILGSFLFSLLWSLLFDFHASTSTHCNVVNYLPSISASIGSRTPQKCIWRLSIGFHSTPRFFIAIMYYIYLHQSKLILLLSCLEITSLLGLSYISSMDNFNVHANFFGLFIVTSLVNMLMGCSIGTNKVKRVKKFLTWTNLINCILMTFFYSRHNQYCEPGIYTLFALSEYIVVLSNIAYNFQAYHDFKGYYVSVTNLISITHQS